MDRLAEISALRDRLHTELALLDSLLGTLESDAATDQRNLERRKLGEVWGQTKLATFMGVSRNTAHKLMVGELANLAWQDEYGRLRVNATDIERWLAGHTRGAA